MDGGGGGGEGDMYDICKKKKPRKRNDEKVVFLRVRKYKKDVGVCLLCTSVCSARSCASVPLPPE
jgi:hypothetical protein